MTGHTLGPWFWNSGESPIIIRNGYTPGDTHVCTISGSGSNESSIADARLISAAPDLLEACKAAEDDLTAYGLHLDEDECSQCRIKTLLRAAIAKAEGKP